MNLKEALAKDKLKQFIKEREDSPPADKERFDTTLGLMITGSKEVPVTSPADSSGDCSGIQTRRHKKKDT